MNSRVIIDFIARTPALRQGTNQVIGSLDAVERAAKRVRQALFVAGAGVGGSLATAGLKAAAFQRDMQNVNSIVQDSDKVFARTSASVLDLATKVPRSAQELAKGAYQIVSAGFTSPKQTVDILAAAGRDAAAGLTSVDTAALALVTTMNAYGGAAGNATRVSDLLFQTVNVGQVSFEQLATNLGDFIGIAQASGATLAETLASYASITIATGQASRSATSLQGIYRQLIKPSDELQARLESIGFTSGKTAIQSLGLQGSLEALTKGMDTTAVARMFQDVEGLNGVLALTGPNAEKARANLAKFTNESAIAGATQRALNEQSKSVAYQFDQFKSTIGAVAIQFGQRLLPFMKAGVYVLNLFAQGISAIPGPIKSVLAVLGVLAAFMGTAGLTLLLWYSRLNLIRSGLQLLGQTNALAFLMNFVRNSTLVQGTLTLLQTRLGLTTASLGAFAAGIGIALAAMVAVPIAAKAIQNALFPQNVNAMTKALLEWGDAGEYAGTRLTEKFGSGLKGIARDVETFTTGNKGLFKSFNLTGVTGAVRRIDELDKAFAKLVQTGNVNRAKREFKVLEDSLRSQGFTTAQINQAFNDYLGALADIELQNRAAGDSSEAMAGQIESVGDAIKRAEEEAKAYAETIDGLRDVARQFLGLTNITTAIEEAHRAKFDNAQKAAKALEDQRDRAREVSKAQDDMAKSQDKVNRLVNNQTVPGSKGWYELRDAQRDVADAAERLRNVQKGVNDEYKTTAPTLAEIRGEYQKQIDAYKEFNANLVILAKRGAPVEVIRELQKMGPEGVAIAKQLASATPEEFEKMKGVLAEKVKLEGEAYARELDLQLVVAAAVARKGAAATTQAILDEVKKIAPGINAELPAIRTALGQLGVMPIESGTGINQGSASLIPKINGNTVNQMPGTTASDGRTVVSKDAPRVLDPSKYIWSTLADTGGTVRPGFNLVENRTKLPEYILTAAQARAAIPRGSSGGNSTTSTTSTTTYQFGDIYAQDLTGAMRQADQKKRLGALVG